MFEGSLVLGITLLCFAFWLHWNETQGWPNEDSSFKGELANQYLRQRSRARKRIHILIAACGVLILVAALAGPGPVWIAAWMSVIAALMTVIVLAGFDAFRTHRFQSTKLRDVRGEVLRDDD
jgi:peptidoglycan/LPS O-acetylase OafA/YrhL